MVSTSVCCCTGHIKYLLGTGVSQVYLDRHKEVVALSLQTILSGVGSDTEDSKCIAQNSYTLKIIK